MTDHQLLAEFARNGSHAAFAELVKRHTDTVYAACLRVLGDPHLAEDAAQATFLVLLRKCRTLSSATILAGWLYRTAELAARDLRKARERRIRHEREAGAMIATRGEDLSIDEDWLTLRPHLDAALASLPAVQCDAVVLRYLKGHSHAEAAREMRCPEDTLHTRLRRGLDRLRAKLAARGTNIPAVALATLLDAHAAEAAPAGLTSAIQAACLGKAGASSLAIQTAEEVMQTMLWTNLKIYAASVALLASLTFTGLGAWGLVGAADQAEKEIKAPTTGLPLADSGRAGQAPVAVALRWGVPQMISFDSKFKTMIPSGMAVQDEKVHLFSFAGFNRGQPELWAAAGSERGTSWTACRKVLSGGCYGILPGPGVFHLCIHAGGDERGGRGNALEYVRVSTEFQELKRVALMPGTAQGRYLGAKILGSERNLLLLSTYDSLGNNGDMDMLALQSGDGGDTWTGPIHIKRGIQLGDMADFPPCSFASGKTIGWFHVANFIKFGSGISGGATVALTLSRDGGATWSEQSSPAFATATSESLARYIPLACAVSGPRVYLIVAGFTQGAEKIQLIYHMAVSEDLCKTWREAVPVSPPLKPAELSTFVTLNASGERVAFGYTECVGDWKFNQTRAHISYSTNGGLTWQNLHAFDGVKGYSMCPQAAFDEKTTDLHVAATAFPKTEGKPWLVVRTFGIAPVTAGKKLPDWFVEKAELVPTPEDF